MWQFETELMRNIKPHAGGDLRIINNKVYVMQSVSPAITFKGDALAGTRGVSEEWMKNTAEISIRSTVRILTGDFKNDVHIAFEAKGQDGSWWISDDGQTIYVTARWINDKNTAGLNPRKMIDETYYSIYKSIDAGKTFKQLIWPEHRRVEQILFAKDGQRGYAIGGHRTIWRTANGGQSWRSLEIADIFKLYANTDIKQLSNENKLFDAYTLDDTGVLWLSCYVFGKHKEDSGALIYRVPWDEKLVDMNQLKPYALLPQLDVSDIEPAPQGGLYLITEKFNFVNRFEGHEKKEFGFAHLVDGKLAQQYNFGDYLYLGKLYVGARNLIYISGITYTKPEALTNRDVAFVSKNNGKTWDRQNPHISASAEFFDSKNNKVWSQSSYSLYSRKLD